MPDIRLKVFCSVAKNLSFTKASTELHISQPAVSKNIKELESEFSLRLFERKGNRIALTQAGLTLLKYADQIFDIYKKINFDFNLIKGKFAGKLQLGASTTIGQYVLPPILAQFHQAYPDIDISLINENTLQIEKEVIAHNIELGIVEGRSKSSLLKYIPFMKDEIVPIIHTKNKSIKKEELSLEELKRIPIVLREVGSGSLEVISHELAKLQIDINTLNIVMHLGSTESIKLYLENSNCLGFVSIAAINREIANGSFRIVDIKDLSINRMFYFTHRQGQSDGMADLFMQFMQNQITNGYKA